MNYNEHFATKYKVPDGIALRHIGEIYLIVPYKKISQIGCDQFVATNYVGALIWKTCETPSSLQDIIKIMKAKFNVSESELAKDAANVIDLFKKYGLLVEVI